MSEGWTAEEALSPSGLSQSMGDSRFLWSGSTSQVPPQKDH